MNKKSRVEPECPEMLPAGVRRQPSCDVSLRQCLPQHRSCERSTDDRRQENRDSPNVKPAYAAMVAECARWNICRTEAFRLARMGLLDTFAIGRKRYVWIASLESLPTRLRASQEGQS